MTLRQILRGCWTGHLEPSIVRVEDRTLFECPRCFATWPMTGVGSEDFWQRQQAKKLEESRRTLPRIGRKVGERVSGSRA